MSVQAMHCCTTDSATFTYSLKMSPMSRAPTTEIDGLTDTCHKTKLADSILCPKFTKIAGHCIVDKGTAFDICSKTPGCKYVLTTSNGAWNMAFQNAAMLGKDPLSYNSQWTSCELPATTDAKIFNERGPGGERGGDSVSTTTLRHEKMMSVTEEVKLSHVYLLFTIIFACAYWEIFVVKVASNPNLACRQHWWKVCGKRVSWGSVEATFADGC